MAIKISGSTIIDDGRQLVNVGVSTLSAVTVTNDISITDGSLNVGDGGHQSEILIKKADNNTSDHLQFYNGTTRMGEIGCHDTTWLRINQETNKNIYTPRIIRADGGFLVGANDTVDHFPSGTKMIFQQTNAPTGWTKITSNTNQRALRVVSGTAGSGGSHNFTSVFTSSRATSGASVSSHTLTTNEIPSHTHDTPNHTHTVSFDIGNTDLDHTHGAGNYNTDSQGNHAHEITDSSSQDSGDGFAGYQGGSGGSGSNNVNSSTNGSHTHDITGTSGSGLGNHNHDVHNMSVGDANPTTHSEGGGSGHSHGFSDATVDLAVYYIDVIIAEKD